MKNQAWRFLASAAIGLALLAACTPAQTGGPSVAPAKPAPSFPAGSYMETIQKRGTLKAGVKQDQLGFGYLDPRTNKTEGFDVDVVKAIALAIFGDAEKVSLTKVVSAQRIPFLQEDQVDLVAATMTINDERKQQIDFSDIYYLAGQSLLVPKNSTLTKLEDAKGKTICSAKGSTSETNIRRINPDAQLLLFDTYSECLAAMQQGRADGISTDDAVLKGLARQDPNTKLVGDLFTKEPYGVGIKKGRPEFVTFVNGVIAEMKKDGRWAAAHKANLGEPVPAPPAAQ